MEFSENPGTPLGISDKVTELKNKRLDESA